ncbi:MAG: hypothetical protein WB392_04040 [Methanotrichaceae archaeon]
MNSSLPAPLVVYVKGIGDIPSAIAYWMIPNIEVQLSSFVSSLPILFAESLIAIIFTYYMLIDGRQILDRAIELMPDQKREIPLFSAGAGQHIHNPFYCLLHYSNNFW